MRGRRRAAWRSVARWWLAAALASGAPAARAQATPPPPSFRWWTPQDTRYGIAALAAVVVTGAFDAKLQSRIAFAGGDPANRLADAVQPFGTPIVWAPALLLAAGAGHVSGHRDWTSASVRIAVSGVVAAAADGALKLAFGRARPSESPDDPYDFKPFSGQVSFPSGHATLAFAMAAVISHETGSRWVPWVGYPLAGLVGWSRVHDNEHWTSDVVAGAALGAWVAVKSDDWLRARRGATGAVEPFVGASGRSLDVGLERRF